MRCTYLAHLIFFDLLTLIISGEPYKMCEMLYNSHKKLCSQKF
jgi:hypothetical protein